LLILVIGVSIIFFSPAGSRNIELPFLPVQQKFANLEIDGATIKVELADTPSKRSRGLGGRQSLGENEGMLFIFEKQDKHPFRMKGLSFPLDFVWFRDDQVLDILENIAPPASGQPDSSLPIYSSKEPVNKVLELNAGGIKRLNIKVGGTIKLTRI
jgi:uncharacterized membrane protein (UPF0127 family)